MKPVCFRALGLIIVLLALSFAPLPATAGDCPTASGQSSNKSCRPLAATDYEYLALLKKLGGVEKANAICLALAKDPFHWEHDPAKLYEARAALAAEIMKLQ